MSTTPEHPILFSDAMVRAILAGTKCQTRRVVRHQHCVEEIVNSVTYLHHSKCQGACDYDCSPASPYGERGHRLWVRECWAVSGHYSNGPRYEYRAAPADGQDQRCVMGWKPSIHMPRAACRLVLEVEAVRIERLQDISDDDVMAEGMQSVLINSHDFRGAFIDLWDSINADRGHSWESNPWVWVVSFKPVSCCKRHGFR